MPIALVMPRGLALAVAAAFVLAGCSGGASSSGGPAPSPTDGFEVNPGATSKGSQSQATPTATRTAKLSASEAAAQSAAGLFLGTLQAEEYDLAQQKLCVAGKAKFATGTALRTALGLTDKTLTRAMLGGVTKSTYNGEARMRVTAEVVYSVGDTKTFTLSMRDEGGKPTVCGF